MPLLLPDTPAPVSTEAIRQNLHFTKGVAPDQVAEDHRLGQASGFAPDLVSRNRDEIRARVETEDVLAKTANSPGTQRYLSEQNNLAVSKDDIGNLAETEGWFKHYFTGPAKSLAKQTGAAPFNLGATAYAAIGGTAGAIDSAAQGIEYYLSVGKSGGAFGYVSDWAMQHAQALSDVVQKSELLSLPAPLKDKGLWDNPKLLFNPEWLTYNVGQAATSMIPQIMAAIFTKGGSLAGAAVGGLQEGGGLYQELLLDGETDPDRALVASQAFGLATTVLNKIGLEAIMGKTATKNLAVRAGKAIASGSTEAVTEWLEEPFQALFGGMAQGKGPNELGADIIESLKHVDVMPGAFLFGGGTAYMTHYKAEYDGVKRAEKDATLFASLDELAAGSKTRQRMPAAYEAFVNFAQEQAGGKVSDIFVDAELLQSALPAEQLTELLDKVDISKETFAESVQTGSAVVIPISKYLAHVAGTEVSQAIRNDLRFSENGMSLNEAADARKNWAENMQSIIEEDRRITESNIQFDEEGQLVHDDIYTKLIEAGQNEEVATANAVAWRAFAVTAPTRYDGYYGATPAEVYQKLVPEVQAQAFADHQASRDAVTFHQGGEELGRIAQAIKDDGVEVSIFENNGVINLTKIVVDKSTRGQGKGTAAMQQIFAYADRTGQRIELSPSADLGGSKTRLIKFYKRLGFTENKGKRKDFTTRETMFREPAASGVATQYGVTVEETQQQYAAVVTQHKGTEGWMKAPNGQPTKLNERQWVQAQTPAFKEWFGESKVVDENGEPLVVYHGTDKTFNKINMKKGAQGLFWVSSDKASIENGESGAQGTSQIMELFVKIDNPADWKQYDNLVIDEFKGRGLDGAILPEKDGTFVAFVLSPLQVKSATRNTGQFDNQNPDIRYQSAWHGSPHTFDKFSTDNIGIGEGAQAYGYGLYFAGAKEVAEHYRDALSNARSGLNPFYFQYGGSVYSKDGGGTEYTRNGKIIPKEDYAEAFRNAQELQEKAPNGRLYAVELAPKEDEYLLWDKPLSEQSGKVKDAFKGRAEREYGANGIGSERGAELYKEISHGEGSDKSASEYLHALGIRGIKYLDGTSRGVSFQLDWTDGESGSYDIKRDAESAMLIANEDIAKAVESLREKGKTEAADALESGRLVQRGANYNYVIFNDEDVSITEMFQNPTAPQGAFTVKDGKPLIKLFETANPSTFLHETGHVFFTFMEQMAARTDAPQALKDDWQALVDYTGSKDGKLANEHHETLARALEAYFMEGKAPSPELRTVFQQFAAWLKAIYRQVSALNAPVNDEIRQVFDRMFATDTEIEQAKAYYSAKEDFLSVAQVDDTAAAEKYRKLKAKADEDAGDSRFRKYAKAYMQALGGKKALEAKARTEINAQPAYTAADTAVAAGGFSADMLDALIGKEKRVQLSKRRVGLITQKGGADIDAVMAATGYENPGEMFDAILAAENKTTAIERLVKDRIAQQQETIRKDLADGPVAADSDYHSDSRMALLIAEVELINKKRALAAGRDKGMITRLQVQAIRDAARQVLQTKNVTEATKYFQYSRAEAKAAKQAMDAFKKGDFDNAERFKRRELLNHALVLESIKAKEDVESIEGRFNRAVDRKNIDSTYHAQALRFLMVNGLTQRRIAVPENTKSFEAFIEGLRHEDADSPMAGSVPVWSEWALTGKETKGGWRKNFSLAELQEADSLVRWLIETGADIRGGRLAEYQQTLDEVVQEAIAPAASLKNKHIYGETHPMRRGSVWVRKFIADHSQLMFILDSLDGFKAMVKKGSASFGPNRTMIGHKLTEAQDHRDRMQKEVRDKLLAPIRQLAKSAAKHGKSISGLNIPEAMRKDGRVWTFERVVAVALNMGNPTNANRVAAGYGLVTDDEVAMAAGNLDNLTKKEMVERLQQIRSQLSLAKLTQLTSQVLTAEDWGSVQALWNTVNSYWEQLDDVHYKVNHFRREKVQARTFQAQLADGTTVAMDGGYYPLKYDRILSDQVAEWSEQDDLFNESVFGHPGVESGMIKSRVAGPVRMPVDLSLSVLFKHMEDVVHYISHAAIIKDVDRITRDATYAEVVKNKLGREAYHAIRPILRNIAKPDRAVGLHLDTMFDRMRVLASAYVLGLNTSVATKQLFSLPSMWHDIGFGNWLLGVQRVLANPSAAYQAMHELSPYMATRASSFDREIRDSGNAIMGKGFGMDKTRRDQLRDVAFIPIQVMDMVSVLPSWWAAYGAERTRGGDEKTAVRYADEMIRASQPTAKAVEQAKVLYTRTGMTRFFSMFMTFSVTFGNRQRYFYRGWREGKVNTREYAKHLALDAIVPLLLESIVMGVLWGGAGDDDETLLEWIGGLALKGLLYQFSGQVFVRDAAGMAVSAFKNRVLEEDNFVNNLGESAVLTGFKLAERAYVSLLNVMMDLDDDEKSEKAIWAFAEIVSFWAGLPVPKLVRNIKEGMRQFEEEDGTLFNIIAPDPQKRSRN
jgi:GNAT superfamily N-acetyltransferase